MADTIFINYRREDSAANAGRLHDRLAQVFGRKRIFMDDQIPAGIDFAAHLNSQIAACNVLLVVIGPRWVDAKDEAGQRRLHQPDDFVAIEIAAALARDIRVIPVLVDGARIPKASELPDSLKRLAGRQAIEVRQPHFDRDAEALIEKVREALGGKVELGPWRVRALAGAATLAVLLLIGVGGYVFVRHLQKQGSTVPAHEQGSTAPASEVVLFDNWNEQYVDNNPSVPTQFTITKDYFVTYIANYHWNGGQGMARGDIGLRDQNGKVYGPWQAITSSGQGEKQSVNWECKPNVRIPAGTYTVIDSDVASWSQNEKSGRRGISLVKGHPAS